MSVSSAIAEVTYHDTSTRPPRRGGFLIWPDQTIKVGRDTDSEHNDQVFAHPTVSRTHLEIYSVTVDEDGRHPPLIFVRDRQSFHGTHVNGLLIGKQPHLSPGRLLQTGDKITAGPYVTLTFTQFLPKSSAFCLSSLQEKELSLIKDRYIVTNRTIGDGAHAVVYLAEDANTKQQLVCKVHNLNRRVRSKQISRRIRQEATLLSNLDHPNIVSMKAAFQTPDSFYIFTELATGGDLFSLLSRYQEFTELEIRWIIRQVLHGVLHIHSKGVAHRDIKPENILCAIAPMVAFRIVLSDFGDSAIESQGRIKSNVGTSFYRAPECHCPEQGHGLAVDIWSVGMLTLQLVVGLRELPGLQGLDLTSQGKIDKYLDKVFKEPCEPGKLPVSDNGKDFIRGCLEYDSDLRLTAREALKHDWLREPPDDNQLFRQLQRDNVSGWKPRGIICPVIEDLSEELASQSIGDAETQPQHELVSPHFVRPMSIGPTSSYDGGEESEDLGVKPPKTGNRREEQPLEESDHKLPSPRKPQTAKKLTASAKRKLVAAEEEAKRPRASSI